MDQSSCILPFPSVILQVNLIKVLKGKEVICLKFLSLEVFECNRSITIALSMLKIPNIAITVELGVSCNLSTLKCLQVLYTTTVNKLSCPTNGNTGMSLGHIAMAWQVFHEISLFFDI